MVNVLNKCTNSASRLTFLKLSPLLFFVLDIVACQRFAQDRDKRGVAGKKNAVEFVLSVVVFGCGVETYQCFAGAGDSSHETDRFESSVLRCTDDVVNRV